MRDRLGELGLRKLLRDTDVLIDRLALSVASGAPVYLSEWAEWVGPIYRRRKVPMDDLIHLCEGLRQASSSALAPEERPGRRHALVQDPDLAHEREDHAGERDDLQGEQRSDALRPAKPGECRERKDGAADRQRERSGQRDHAVAADQHARRGQTVDGEQRRHDGESGSDEDDAPVTPSHADDRQGKRCDRRHDRADPDTDEVHIGSEAVCVLPEEVKACSGHHCACAEQGQIVDHAIAGDWPHQRRIGCDHRHLEARKGELAGR